MNDTVKFEIAITTLQNLMKDKEHDGISYFIKNESRKDDKDICLLAIRDDGKLINFFIHHEVWNDFKNLINNFDPYAPTSH